MTPFFWLECQIDICGRWDIRWKSWNDVYDLHFFWINGFPQFYLHQRKWSTTPEDSRLEHNSLEVWKMIIFLSFHGCSCRFQPRYVGNVHVHNLWPWQLHQGEGGCLSKKEVPKLEIFFQNGHREDSQILIYIIYFSIYCILLGAGNKKIFVIFIPICGEIQFDERAYFSNGLVQPPTWLSIRFMEFLRGSWLDLLNLEGFAPEHIWIWFPPPIQCRFCLCLRLCLCDVPWSAWLASGQWKGWNAKPQHVYPPWN